MTALRIADEVGKFHADQQVAARFWIFIAIFADIFRRNDLSGWAKAGWIFLIFIVPFLGALIYVIARPKMTAQDREMIEQAQEAQRRISGYSPADEIAKLAELRDKLRDAKNAYWGGQVDIQWQTATAWEREAEGKYDEALALMSAAADAEDKTNIHPVMPGRVVPARELYGDLLLERGLAKEALAAYQSSDKSQPNRYRTLAGAAKAAEKLGDKQQTKEYYEKLIALAGGPDVDRPELAAARAFVASN